MIDIGVLALQGSIAEHLRSLSRIEGVNPCEVRTASDLEKVSGLILPGGESTTIGKLIKDFELSEHIVKKAEKGMPVWGTCAGMILMAKKVADEEYVHLGIMDITVRRNAYGGQLDSFSLAACIPAVSQEEIPLVFIRAPWVENAGEKVRILLKINNRPVAVQQNSLLATSFHPELTMSLAFHKYFAEIVKQYLEKIY